MLRRICVLLIRSREHVLDQSDHPAPIQHHDLYAMQIVSVRDLSSQKDHQEGFDVSDVLCNMSSMWGVY